MKQNKTLQRRYGFFSKSNKILNNKRRKGRKILATQYTKK